MLLSTTGLVQHHRILEYKGIVAAEVVIGNNVLRDMWASLKDFTGGNIGTMETALTDARKEAIERLESAAFGVGANAVIGISLDYETFGQNNTILMVCATGTAVVVEGETE